MTQFLLFFSLLLHGITFFIIIYFYRQFKDFQNMDQMKKSIREVEDLFESYLLELKDENEKLLNILKENGKNVKVQQADEIAVDTPIFDEEKMENITIKKDEVVPVDKAMDTDSSKEDVKDQSEPTYKPENIMFQDQVEEPSVESSVLNLYEQGKSIDEIAKQMNRGKTEIELIIKFHTKS